MKTPPPSIVDLEKKRKQALRNASRQRRKEVDAKHDRSTEVRVSSSFWEQTARDYQRQINDLRSQERAALKVFIDCGREAIELQDLRITVRMGRDLSGQKTMYIGKARDGAELDQEDVKALLPYLSRFAKKGTLVDQ